MLSFAEALSWTCFPHLTFCYVFFQPTPVGSVHVDSGASAITRESHTHRDRPSQQPLRNQVCVGPSLFQKSPFFMANIKIQILQLLHLSVYTEIKDKGLSVTHYCGAAFQHPSGLCNSTEMWPGVLHEASTPEKLGLSKSVGWKGQSATGPKTQWMDRVAHFGSHLQSRVELSPIPVFPCWLRKVGNLDFQLT